MSITIFFKCGCSIDAKDRKLSISKDRKQKFMCIEHQKLIDHVELTCEMCGKIVQINMLQLKIQFCTDCITKRASNRYFNDKQPKCPITKDYHFACGCITKRSDAIVVKKKVVCGEHKAVFTKKSFTCRLCGKYTEETDPNSNTTRLCPTCKIKNKTKIKKAQDRRIKRDIKSIDNCEKQPQRFTNCIHYERCLAISALTNKKLNCSHCENKNIGSQEFYIADTNFSILKQELRLQV